MPTLYDIANEVRIWYKQYLASQKLANTFNNNDDNISIKILQKSEREIAPISRKLFNKLATQSIFTKVANVQ